MEDKYQNVIDSLNTFIDKQMTEIDNKIKEESKNICDRWAIISFKNVPFEYKLNKNKYYLALIDSVSYDIIDYTDDSSSYTTICVWVRLREDDIGREIPFSNVIEILEKTEYTREEAALYATVKYGEKFEDVPHKT